MRTLLVEDDPVQRDALLSGLQRLGLDVTGVPDANAGLVAHLRQPFDLLIIDMVLPGMDGLKLCQKIRSIRGGDHPYIVMVTGRGGIRDLTRVLDAGADDFLTKPIDPSLLLTRVRIAERQLKTNARHRQAREALPSLDVEERILQLCNLEAMEQTAAWNPAYHPSYVVAYARENIRIRDETIVADGAAFLSDGAWYELAYHCAVTPDFTRIAGFDFRVGSSIPREDWEAYALPTGIDPGLAKGATAEN